MSPRQFFCHLHIFLFSSPHFFIVISTFFYCHLDRRERSPKMRDDCYYSTTKMTWRFLTTRMEFAVQDPNAPCERTMLRGLTAERPPKMRDDCYYSTTKMTWGFLTTRRQFCVCKIRTLRSKGQYRGGNFLLSSPHFFIVISTVGRDLPKCVMTAITQLPK